MIGNDDYTNITQLKKAVNDATALGKTLASMGFEVTTATNVSRRDMNRAIQTFVSKVRQGDVAMLFYAGHGIEIGGKNYLLPVDVPDADSGGAGFIEAESVALDDILERLRERDARLNIVVLDACRNNPFANSRTRAWQQGRSRTHFCAPGHFRDVFGRYWRDGTGPPRRRRCQSEFGLYENPHSIAWPFRS
ncbi:MAG: caspase family protein [Nitratireductor sp.]